MTRFLVQSRVSAALHQKSLLHKKVWILHKKSANTLIGNTHKWYWLFLSIFLFSHVITILRTFFESKELTKEAMNWLNVVIRIPLPL